MGLFVNVRGVTEGPYHVEQLRELVAAGKIQPTDLVFVEQKNQWIEIATIPELYQPQTPLQSGLRTVGLTLGIGIFLVPYVFSWFTLRRGYTKNAKIIAFLWLGIMCLGAISGTNQNSRQGFRQTSVTGIPRNDEVINGPNWPEVDSIYNLQSNTTNVQKEKAWVNFKGKRIWWVGTVSEISEGMLGGYTLQIKMNEDTFTSDLIIKLRRSEKAKAQRYSKGDEISFTGRLVSWGTILPISLDDGEIK